MLDSLSSLDGCTSSVGQAWLHQVLQRHDIARVLEPLLLLLLHPKTQRVSVQRVQAERHWSKSMRHFEENRKIFTKTCNSSNGMEYYIICCGIIIVHVIVWNIIYGNLWWYNNCSCNRSNVIKYYNINNYQCYYC